MITQKLASVYANIENKWFAFLEFLQEKGIPAYKYAELLETRGIPSLPFTIALIVLIAALLLSFTTPNTIQATVTLNLRDDYGAPLSGVRVEFLNEAEQTVKIVGSAYNGKKVRFDDVIYGAKLIVRASKKDYGTATKELELTSSEVSVVLVLERLAEKTVARVLLVDSETSTTVFNADCNVSFGGTTIKGTLGSAGTIEFYGVPAETDVRLRCSADGYEQVDEIVQFKKDETLAVELVPSAPIHLAGQTNLLISVKDLETQELLPGVKIKIINAETDVIISDVNSPTGEHIEKINYGTKVKVVVEKEGYLSHTEELTLREEDVALDIFLEKGGTRLTVKVLSKELALQVSADVMLLDENFAKIDAKKTDFSGSTVFEGLDPNKTYYVTAFKQGFLPAFQQADLTKGTIQLLLEKATAENSALVAIRVVDSYGKEASNATVRFYRLVDSTKVPLGIPPRKTGLTGTVVETLPEGSIIVEIETDSELAEATLDVKAGEDQEIEIQLERKASIVELHLVDQEGNAVQGYATIKTKSGKLLFEGETGGTIIFDSEGQESFFLNLETDDGRTFEQEVRINGDNTAEVRIVTEEEALHPTIEFVGVFDAKGQAIEGVTANEFAWLRFNVSFPQGSKAGVHIRVGPDSVTFADSQEIGIYGFDATASGFVYGRSYQPPFGQAADLTNKGQAGERNKWLELYFDNAPSQAVISVKVKTENLHEQSEFEVHYIAL
jgi:hypothetical protein